MLCNIYITIYILFFSNRAFAGTIPRPFTARYSAYTQSVEVINSKDQVINLTKAIRGEKITIITINNNDNDNKNNKNNNN